LNPLRFQVAIICLAVEVSIIASGKHYSKKLLTTAALLKMILRMHAGGPVPSIDNDAVPTRFEKGISTRGRLDELSRLWAVRSIQRN
jgi:hypothetical protein